MKKGVLIKCCIIVIFLNLEILTSSSLCKLDMARSSYIESFDYCEGGYSFGHFNKYNVSEITKDDLQLYHTYSLAEVRSVRPNPEKKWCDIAISSSKILPTGSILNSGLMNSAWPMYCHDTHHTGRTPYSSINTCDEIWRFKQPKNYFVEGGPVVGDDGTIYFGGMGFYALYPNGSFKWKCDNPMPIESISPAIDDNGVIYFGDGNGYFYAINPDGTEKWKSRISTAIYSSPVITEDGIIIIGNSDNWEIDAYYPNGTLKWAYKTDLVVYSSPAIGPDGTIYCGSHDTYLYALYPNNGTLKWKYKTDGWIRTSPCIGDDGTIYVVSLDSYLHALNPDGTQKWKTDVGAGTSPTIGQDGTIYAGYRILHAVNPTNGSVNWTFDVGGTIQGSTPCHSAEDIIFFGTHLTDYAGGGDFVAVNPDGSERWRKRIAQSHINSAPAISENGTVYVGSACMEEGYARGYLYAFGICELKADANGPYYRLVNEPVQLKGSASGGYSPFTSWHWDFGDTHTSDEQNPTHTYIGAGNHTIILTVTDNTSNTSSDTTYAWIQVTNDPPDKPTIDGLTNGKAGTPYNYTFKGTDPDGSVIWYYIEWGDNTNTGWIGPYDSGTQITKSHIWDKKGTYIIKAKAKDPYDAESSEATLKITIPRNKIAENRLFLKFLDKFSLSEKLIFLLN